MLSLNTANNPSITSIKELSLSDLAIMSFTSQELRKRLGNYYQIDSFTMPDPFSEKDSFNYFIIVDKSNVNRIISFVALKDMEYVSLWDKLLGREMSRLDVSKEDAFTLKKELMPKDTNNFYSIRKEGSIIGYIAFAFEICGKREP